MERDVEYLLNELEGAETNNAALNTSINLMYQRLQQETNVGIELISALVMMAGGKVKITKDTFDVVNDPEVNLKLHREEDGGMTLWLEATPVEDQACSSDCNCEKKGGEGE